MFTVSSLFLLSSFSKHLFLASLQKPRSTGLRSFQPFLLNYLHQRVNNLFRPAEAAEHARPFCEIKFSCQIAISSQTFAITWCYKFRLRKSFVRNLLKKKFQLPSQTMTLSGSWLAQFFHSKHNSWVRFEWDEFTRLGKIGSICLCTKNYFSESGLLCSKILQRESLSWSKKVKKKRKFDNEFKC